MTLEQITLLIVILLAIPPVSVIVREILIYARLNSYLRFSGVQLSRWDQFLMAECARRANVKMLKYFNSRSGGRCNGIYSVGIAMESIPNLFHIMLEIQRINGKISSIQDFIRFRENNKVFLGAIREMRKRVDKDFEARIFAPQLAFITILGFSKEQDLSEFDISFCKDKYTNPAKRLKQLLTVIIDERKKEITDFTQTEFGKSCIGIRSNGDFYVKFKIKGTVNTGEIKRQSFANLMCVLAHHYRILDRVPYAHTSDLAKASYMLFDIPWTRPKADEFYKAMERIKNEDKCMLDIAQALRLADSP